MDRLERVERHGRYVIIASAAKVLGKGSHSQEWDVLVSVADLDKGSLENGPKPVNFGERYWLDPHAGLTHAMSFAAQKIEAEDPAVQK
jgi:hypothetical protein